MATSNLNNNIQLIHPLYKNDPGRSKPGKDADGVVRTPSSETEDIAAHTTIIDSVSDNGKFEYLIPIINNLESVREDLQDLYTWTVCAFGKDCSKAASQGPKGDTGAQGPKGDTGLSISAATVTLAGRLQLTLTDNSIVDAGNVSGIKSAAVKDRKSVV